MAPDGTVTTCVCEVTCGADALVRSGPPGLLSHVSSALAMTSEHQ
jgi:hypothetical protein